MKRISIYFSDIVGTISGSVPNSKEDYKKLVQLLDRIKTLDGSSTVAFSLISSDAQETVMAEKAKIESVSSDSITFGRQFFDLGYNHHNQVTLQDKFSGKSFQMIEYIDDLQKYYDIASIYYADDVEIYQQMMEVASANRPWNSKLHFITPRLGAGLSETNLLLESTLEEKEKQLSK